MVAYAIAGREYFHKHGKRHPEEAYENKNNWF
jgi:hypothetical protein